VGTDTGAIASISSHDRGARVVPVRQPEALARAISEVLRCELPCDHMEQRILRLSERFSISNYLSAHESLYANAI
jgi:glycosyltransferase involved in cell wall biosynthesis